MQSFLCRVLAVVFALNCILPTPSAWAQVRRAPAQKAKTGTSSRTNVGAAVSQAADKQLQTKINNATKRYENRKLTWVQRKNALVELHRLKDQQATQEEARAKKAAQEAARQAAEAYQQDLRSGRVVARDATYVAPRPVTLPIKAPKNDVLELLANDELTLQNMGEFIDPMGNPNDNYLMNTVYASEALGNTLDYMQEMAKNGSMDGAALAQFNQDLKDVYLRMAYREISLSAKPHDSMVRTMAVGSLRIAMLKTHNYFTAMGIKDPLLTKQNQPVATTGKGSTKPYTELDGKRIFYPTPNAQSVLPPNYFEALQNKYINEMTAAAKLGVKTSDEKFQDVLALADYATKYTLLNDPLSVAVLVKKFDSSAKDTDFKADNAPVVNQIIAGVVDEARQEARGSQKWNNAMQFFANFSDPKSYSLSTRVIALEAASVLMGNQAGDKMGQGEFALRQTFARRAADLYEPLQGSYYKDYGLDSKQMQALSDKLSNIYNQFATEPLKLVEITNNGTTAIPGVKGLIEPGEKGIVIANDPKTSIPAIAPANSGNMVQNPDGSVRTIYGYVYTSKGRWVEIAQHNNLNRAKVDKENATAFFKFVGDVFLWVYAGAILQTACQAFSFARGAMLALPKALNVAAKSNKGRKLLAFRVELTKAGRLASYTAKAAGNNVTLPVRYIETGKAPTTTLPAKMGEGVAPVVKKVEQPSMRVLQNKYPLWNPNRWLGLPRNRQIIGLDASQVLPGGVVNNWSLDFTGRLASLQDGVKNYEMLRLINHSIQGAQKSVGIYPWRLLTFAELREAQAYSRMYAISQNVAQSGGFDGWVNVKIPVYGSDKMPVLASQPGATGVTMETSWFNVTKLGKPANELASTDVVIAPAMGRASALTTFDPLSIPGAVKFPAQMLKDGQWVRQVGEQYFSVATYNNKLGNLFMPHLIPTKAFAQEFVTNPRFAWTMGKAWLKNSAFAQNLKFFGWWALADYAVYPFVMGHVTGKGEQEVKTELAKPKYEGAYDPAKVKEDEKNQEEVLAKLKAEGQDYNTKPMDPYETVTGAEKESPEGMLLGSAYLFGRETLGNLGVTESMYVPASLQNRLQYQAASVNFNRASGEGNKVKNQKALDNIIKAQTENVAVQKRVTLESYKPYVSAAELKQMGAWYDEYLNMVIASLRSNASSATKQKQQEDAAKLLTSRLHPVEERVQRQQELLGEAFSWQEKARNEILLSAEKTYWIIKFAQYGLSDKSGEARAFFESFIPRFLSVSDIKDNNAKMAAAEKLNQELTNKYTEWETKYIEPAKNKHNQQVKTEKAEPFASGSSQQTIQVDSTDNPLKNFHLDKPATAQ